MWSGAPEPWGYARRKWGAALFGVPFTAFAVFWTYLAISPSAKTGKPAPGYFPFMGLVFVAIGLSMLLAPFFAAWKARRVAYVLAPTRAIIIENVWRLKVTTYDASGLVGFERVSHGGTAGDIVFQRTISRHSLRSS